MESDPWADAPSTPKPSSLPNSPAKATSPAVRTVEAGPSSPSARPPSPAPEAAAEPLVESPTDPFTQEDAPDAQTKFDDFDDFDEPAAGSSTFPASADTGEEDAFGDFGDFEEGDFEEPQPQPPAPVLPRQPEWVSSSPTPPSEPS